MAELSSAAQAVKDHFLANVPIGLEQGLAAALRAAADQAADLQVPWSYTGSSYQLYDKGLHAAAEHLRAIAAELDNTPQPS